MESGVSEANGMYAVVANGDGWLSVLPLKSAMEANKLYVQQGRKDGFRIMALTECLESAMEQKLAMVKELRLQGA